MHCVPIPNALQWRGHRGHLHWCTSCVYMYVVVIASLCREPTQVDLEAILRIQRVVKRYQIRVATRSFLEGTKEFQDFQNNLLAGREALEPLTEVFATEVFK